MSEKWTKGPWEYKETRDNFENYAPEHGDSHAWGGSIMSRGQHVARIWSDVSDQPMEHVHNAQLIAAAPELYSALAALEWLDGFSEEPPFCPMCGHHEPAGHAKNCKLYEALKKARGAV